MRNRLISLVAVLLFCMPASAQYTYLVNACKVVDSEECSIYKYTGKSSEPLKMAGGVVGYGGFNMVDEGSFVTFDLGGRYETLTFQMGHYYRCTEDVGAVTVRADGNKILDVKIRGYEIPQYYTLDVAGVKELTFSMVVNDLDLIVADALLWTAGQTPVDIRKPVNPATGPCELVRTLKPYYVTNFMEVITPDSDAPVRLNRQVYEYGLRGNMTMALIGTLNGSAFFNLQKQYTRLSFVAGCHDDVTGGAGSGWVTVKADGKIVDEIEIKEGDIARQIVLDIPACEVLSFHTEQIEGESYAELAQIMVYPAGQDVPEMGMPSGGNSYGMAPPDPRLKSLPDVCKLLSNIEPYQVIGKVSKQIYDGASDYLTFSMGGTKFSEGIILYQTASFWDDNLSACATFDVGNEFDYISFTAGYVSKSWHMNDDMLMVYADDELVFSTTLIPTYPNQHFVVPIKKCRILRFTNRGSGSLDVAAFGVSDIVLYRGEPVENDLFVHPRPECPHTVDLIDLGLPYIHYISGMADSRDDIVYDGTTKKKYFELGGERIYKGFLLQTSTHFSLDFGVLGSNEGTDAAASGIVGATAVGASAVATGAAVGGTAVSATLAPMAAFLMLAAGGEAVENSCAAFNTYGEYNAVKFKVGCLEGYDAIDPYHEHLMIGSDQKVVANLSVYEGMEPQEVTVPIEGCSQLMFWLANTNGNSEKFLIYDIVVTKDKLPLNIPVQMRRSIPVVSRIKTSELLIDRDYERFPSSGKSDEVDSYLSAAYSYYGELCDIIDSYSSDYYVYTYYLDSSKGPIKAVQLRSSRDYDSRYDIPDEYRYLTERHLDALGELRSEKLTLKLDYAAANANLLKLGFDAVTYRKYLKEANRILKECFDLVDRMYEDKMQEYAFLDYLMRNAMSVDGVQSTEECILCPLTADDVLPQEPLEHVAYFDGMGD